MAFTKREKGIPQDKQIHAYICTPAYDGKVEANFSQALAESSYCAPLYGIRVTAGVMGNGAFIDLARNIFVKKFLEEFKECTHLFFIDADLKWEARAFVGLLQANLPICAGVYPKRQKPEEYPFRGAENPDGGGLWFVDDWLQCDRVPTGFLCIRREVIEEMAADAPKIAIHNHGLVPWVFHTEFGSGDDTALKALAEKYNLSPEFMEKYGQWLPTDGQKFIGEDYGFCHDYKRKYGKNIPVWANFDFIHGGHEGNLFKWLVKEKEIFDAKEAA